MPIQKVAANAVKTVERKAHEYLGVGAQYTRQEIAQAEKLQKAGMEALNNVETKVAEYTSPYALVNKSAMSDTIVKRPDVATKSTYTSPFDIVTPESEKSVTRATTGAEVGQKLDIIDSYLLY